VKNPGTTLPRIQMVVFIVPRQFNFICSKNNKYEYIIYYRSGTGGTLLRVHSPGSSTFLREMTSWLASSKCDVVKSKM